MVLPQHFGGGGALKVAAPLVRNRRTQNARSAMPTERIYRKQERRKSKKQGFLHHRLLRMLLSLFSSLGGGAKYGISVGGIPRLVSSSSGYGVLDANPMIPVC